MSILYGGNGVSTFFVQFKEDVFHTSYFRMSSNIGQIGLTITELLALERQRT